MAALARCCDLPALAARCCAEAAAFVGLFFDWAAAQGDVHKDTTSTESHAHRAGVKWLCAIATQRSKLSIPVLACCTGRSVQAHIDKVKWQRGGMVSKQGERATAQVWHSVTAPQPKAGWWHRLSGVNRA